MVDANYFPDWLAYAAVPAAAVIAFFWKGDDAIGPGMKAWLNMKLGSRDARDAAVSIIDSLSKVFGTVFGRHRGGLPSFWRVAVISTLSMFVWISALGALHPLADSLQSDWFPDCFLLILNIAFDYASVGKALFIMDALKRVNSGAARTGLYLLIEFACNIILLLLYLVPAFFLVGPLFTLTTRLLFGMEVFGRSIYIPTTTLTFLTFGATTILTFLLSVLYIIGSLTIRAIQSAGVAWLLPIEAQPVRSIGIIAGAFVFLILLLRQVVASV